MVEERELFDALGLPRGKRSVRGKVGPRWEKDGEPPRTHFQVRRLRQTSCLVVVTIASSSQDFSSFQVPSYT